MRDDEPVEKHGLPPRERNADVSEHAGNSTMWMGVIAVLAVVALLMFGTRHVNNITASNPVPNTEPGVTTGAAPAAPSKLVQ